MCVLLCGRNMEFFSRGACISVIGCMYIYIWIYISMMMMISWGTFFSEVPSSCFCFLRGIIHLMVRSLWQEFKKKIKIARLCSYLANRGHNIYDPGASCRIGVHEWEDSFFFSNKKRKRKKTVKEKEWKKLLTSLGQPVFLASLGFERGGSGGTVEFSWVMQMFHRVLSFWMPGVFFFCLFCILFIFEHL